MYRTIRDQGQTSWIIFEAAWEWLQNKITKDMWIVCGLDINNLRLDTDKTYSAQSGFFLFEI